MPQPSWLDRHRRPGSPVARKSPFARKPNNRLRGVGLGQQAQGGGDSVLSTQASYDYLLGSLRVNAPGYADQDAFQMSRSYLSSVYLAVHAKVVQAGVADFELYEQGDDPEERIPLSRYEDVYKLIANPNPEDTFGEILEQITLQYNLTGTALVWLPREGDSYPQEMYVLSTASVLPQPISPRYPNGAYLVQPWYPAGPYAQMPVSQGVGSTIPNEQIVRIKEPHPFFRWIGYSPLFATSLQTDVTRQIDVSRSNSMMQGLDPSGIISFDPAVKQPDDAMLRRFEAQVQSLWAGPKNSGKLLVAPAGAEFSPFGGKPSDMAYQEGWMQLLDFTLAALGMNKGVAGMTDGITYATLFASLRAFYLMSLNPFLSKVAAKLTTKLIHPYFSPHFGLELQGKSITDESVQKQEDDTLVKAKAITIGELRKRHKLPPSKWDDERCGEQPQQPGMPGMGGEGGPPTELGGQAAPESGEDQDHESESSRPEAVKAFYAHLQGKMNDGRRMNRLMGVLEKNMSNGSVGYHRNGSK